MVLRRFFFNTREVLGRLILFVCFFCVFAYCFCLFVSSLFVFFPFVSSFGFPDTAALQLFQLTHVEETQGRLFVQNGFCRARQPASKSRFQLGCSSLRVQYVPPEKG